MAEMRRKKHSSALNYRRKDRWKVWKTLIQILILIVLVWLIVQALFHFKSYEEPDRSMWTNDQGFVALTYFGVGRTGTPKHVARAELDQQLQALYDQGYQSISQEDILQFYADGSPLPEKALFLAFEDGRNDSVLYSQRLLEKYNYKATVLTYADKMGDNRHRKFIQPRDIKRIVKTGYWETGSNGYRLAYINIFDDEGNHVSNYLDENEADKTSMAYYNHYLMDFIRDEQMIPIENRTEMEERITADYLAMENVYNRTLGYVPDLYMIMHANAMYRGMNRLVSNINSEHTERIFKLHFNREGSAYNTNEENIYDLTRAQVAPYWHTNHLLMKLQKDTGQSMDFVLGDEEQAGKWEQLQGTTEFKDDTIILTSPPAEAGQLYLKSSAELTDSRISVKLLGNVVGQQTIYLRYDREQDSFIRILLENNEIRIEEKGAGQEEAKELFTTTLDEVLWKEEDLAFDKASVYTLDQATSGTASEEEEYPSNIQNTRELEVVVLGNSLSLSVDEQKLVDQLEIDQAVASGGVMLEAMYHPQNEKDDIYDGVFLDLIIKSLEAGEEQEVTIFTNKPTSLQEVIRTIKNFVNRTIDWVIDVF
ncbi:polysaccharide deacetylase family protein [Bacillus horti]|uniref:Polysaccharide deacetylase n=1 Tax=Caldalkalibacillus horti TaxID=77523 RepID=A0ABT9W230_9BACI|nr:polysaccharide deacetylase family protein [Bacillus horti]MDQ0167296.1 hypothetical protein [Bacillus horti]